MPIEFQYLTREGRSKSAIERTADNTVELRFKRGDLAGKCVIRDELRNLYYVFPSETAFQEWYAAQPPSQKCCHEVIFGWQPQRLKFDVDAKAHLIDALPDGILDVAIAAAETSADEAEIVATDETNEYLNEVLAEFANDDSDDNSLNDVERLRSAKIRAIVAIIIEAILDELYVAYYAVEDLLPARDDLIVTDSSGPTQNGWKYSFHIVTLPYFVADSDEAREFSDAVISRLPQPLRVFVDAGVNKRTQNFRLMDSAKPGTHRYKRATPEVSYSFGTMLPTCMRDTMIVAPIGSKILARVYTEANATHGRRAAPSRTMLTRSDPIVKAALELATHEGITKGHEFTEVRGTLICFERLEPSNCRVCEEVHHRDNSLMLSIDLEGGVHGGAWPGTGTLRCRVMEHCRQVRKRAVLVGEIETTAEAARAMGVTTKGPSRPISSPTSRGLSEQVADRVSSIRSGGCNPHDALSSAFEQLPDAQKTIYAEDHMRPYELVPTLAVLAQMKLGKTKALREYINTNFPSDGLETRVVRFVTFRQTFSRALTAAFPDFTLYTDVQGDLDSGRHPRLIVQVESLHRLRMSAAPEPVDLLVLDEVESILAQFNSGLHKHFNAAFAMFQWMLRTARHVVCMDANLSDRTYRTLARMRPAHPPHFHWNRFARAADDTYYFTADQGAWLEKLYEAVRAGKKIVLPTNSLSEAKAFDESLRREFPQRKVMLYSSETAPSEKTRHFGDVHTYWSGLDVLIYTPTCSAGVSFELEHYDALFGYFCDASCDVETCRQMLGRVRNLKTRDHYICLRATGAALPETIDSIRRGVYDKRAGLYRSVDDAALQFKYSEDDGSILYHESDYFYLWLETVRMDNLSRNNFARRFIDQVADTGARVDVLPASTTREGAALLVAHRETGADLKEVRYVAIAEAADLTVEEAATVRDALQAQQDVAPAMILGYEKWILRDYYTWHGRPVDADFVALYNTRNARRVYRNLRRITEEATVMESLKAMQRREADHYSHTMETRPTDFGYVNESRDLLRERQTYTFQPNYLAIWLLRVCGFRCITDRARISAVVLESKLRASLDKLASTADRLVVEFEIPKPNVARLSREDDRMKFISGMLRTFNLVLRQMYGIQVQRSARRSKKAGWITYEIGHTDVGRLFVFSQEPEPDNAPGGARPHVQSNLDPLPDADDGNERINIFLDHVDCSDSNNPPLPDETPAEVTEPAPVDDHIAEMEAFLLELGS